MSKFIYKIEKNEIEEGIELSIYSTNEKLETKCEKTLTKYQIYTKRDQFEQLQIKTDKIQLAQEDFYNKNQEKVVKIEIENQELYKYILNELREHKIETYESDISKEHRYIIENNVKLYQNEEGAKGSAKGKESGKDRKGQKKEEEVPKLKYVSIDIETIGMGENMQIISISIQSPFNDKINKVYVNTEKLSNEMKKEVEKNHYTGFEVVIKQNEAEILEEFKKDIIEYSPQAIIGWNVIDFDFKVIKARMDVHKIEFNFGKTKNTSKLRILNDFYKDSTLDISGVLVFDVIQLLKTNFIIFEDYKLNTVAKTVLKDEKIDILELDENENENGEENGEIVEDKVKAIETQFLSKPSLLVNYNFKDSELVSKIVEELKLIDLMVSRSIITNTPILRVKSPIAALDIMYLTQLHKKKMVAVSNFNFDSTGPISGAYVLSPKRGFYEDVFVFDFKSLYPSIIMTFNIDPFTYEGNVPENEKKSLNLKSRFIVAPNGAKFNREKGILPELILKLYKERDVAKANKDSVKSYAIKTTMNSFYGAMASPKSRFHNREVGGAITAFGREIIKKAKEFGENKGLNVTYGDTDSVFIQIPDLKDKSVEEKKKAGIALEKELNLHFKEWIDKNFGVTNYLTIEMEKIFSKFFIASKKRYVGFDEMSSKIAYTGMEAIRGDWTLLAKNFQMRIIEQIFEDAKKEKIEEFIKNFVEELKQGKFDDMLEYHKRITKPLSQYTKTTPPHVKAAREVEGFSKRLVKYVMLKSGPTHISKLSNLSLPVDYDYEHYIEKQLKGVSDDILESFGIDFENVVMKKKQKSLDRFF